MDERIFRSTNKLYSHKTGSKEEAFINVREKDSTIAERKAILIENIRELILIENIQNPEKTLTIKLLKEWMDKYPEKFFRLTEAKGLLRTYFYNEISNLKFSLGLTKE